MYTWRGAHPDQRGPVKTGCAQRKTCGCEHGPGWKWLHTQYCKKEKGPGHEGAVIDIQLLRAHGRVDQRKEIKLFLNNLNVTVRI